MTWYDPSCSEIDVLTVVFQVVAEPRFTVGMFALPLLAAEEYAKYYLYPAFRSAAGTLLEPLSSLVAPLP